MLGGALVLSEGPPVPPPRALPPPPPFLPPFALNFTEVQDSIEIKAKQADMLQQSDKLSFSIWIHPTNEPMPSISSPNDKKYYLSINVINSYALYCCENRWLRVAFRNEQPGWKWIPTNTQLPLDQWTHIAVTYDSSGTGGLYQNGVLVNDQLKVMGKLEANGKNLAIRIMERAVEDADHAQQTTTHTTTTPTKPNRFTGMIAHLKIWRKVLTAQDIQQEMRLNMAGTGIDGDDVVGWWRFDEGAGPTVYDSTGNVPEGRIAGARWWMPPDSMANVPPSSIAFDFRQMFNKRLASDIIIRVDESSIASSSSSSSSSSISSPSPSSSTSLVPHGAPQASTQDPSSSVTLSSSSASSSSSSSEFLYGHRIVLAARCEAFRAMLMKGMSESTQKEIVIKGVTFSTLSLLIEYLYCDTVEITPQNAVELFIAADMFQVLRLRSMCEHYFYMHVSEENVCTILELADRFQSRFLRQYCISWILAHFGPMMSADSYLALPRDLQQEINMVASRRFFSPSKKRKP
eukprot:TRINITY_DN12370_c1_g1_i1.p1 TRINITY_DN12370_c1_g1~~TRINITY_DN12370_c1_g1_i1.p1  ORF type:complete len:518 (+),score=174.45 TRINITY_DN12370_c1_g1_i1:113-1666(+)